MCSIVRALFDMSRAKVARAMDPECELPEVNPSVKVKVSVDVLVFERK